MRAALHRNSVMRINSRLVSAVVALLAASVPATALALHDHRSMSPRPALVSAHGLTVRSTVGSYCVDGRPRQGTQASLCADYAYPLHTHGRLPLAGGERVTLRFRHNPRILDRLASVKVTPLRVSGDHIHQAANTLAPRQNQEHPSRWRLHMPEAMSNANVLDIAVRYHHGDADFWVGITPAG